MRIQSQVVLAFALLVSAGAVFADDKRNQDELQGTWEATASFDDGKPRDADTAKRTTLVIKSDTITVVEGKLKHTFTFKLDSAKKPKVIDVVGQDGDTKGKTIPGIYDVTSDTFTWCIPRVPEGNRPTELAPKEGDKAMILTAKRAKP